LVIAAVAVILAVITAVIIVLGLHERLHPVYVVEATTTIPPMGKILPSDIETTKVMRGTLTLQGYVPGAAEHMVLDRYALYGLYPGEIVDWDDLSGINMSTYEYDAKLQEMRASAKQQLAAAQSNLQKVEHDNKGVQPTSGGASPSGAASSTASSPTTASTTSRVTSSSTASKLTPQEAVNAAYAAVQQAEQALSRVESDMAVTVSVSEQQGFAIVHSNDHVSIFGTIHSAQSQSAAYVVANSVLVLGREGGSNNGAVSGAVSGILVLALSPHDIERLMLAQQAGSLQVVLDPIGGQAMSTNVGEITSTQLLNPSGTSASATTTYPTVTSPSQAGAVGING
jgi:Flp pilus assembly protein CpaB